MLSMFRRVKKQELSKKPKNAFEDESSIGNILVNLGRITVDELYAAIGQQAQFNDALLGSLLCQRGVTTNTDIARALEIQQKMRSGHAVEAELDILEARLGEAANNGRELSRVIEEKKQERRDRGERSGLFLITPEAVTRKA